MKPTVGALALIGLPCTHGDQGDNKVLNEYVQVAISRKSTSHLMTDLHSRLPRCAASQSNSSESICSILLEDTRIEQLLKDVSLDSPGLIGFLNEAVSVSLDLNNSLPSWFVALSAIEFQEAVWYLLADYKETKSNHYPALLIGILDICHRESAHLEIIPVIMKFLFDDFRKAAGPGNEVLDIFLTKISGKITGSNQAIKVRSRMLADLSLIAIQAHRSLHKQHWKVPHDILRFYRDLWDQMLLALPVLTGPAVEHAMKMRIMDLLPVILNFVTPWPWAHRDYCAEMRQILSIAGVINHAENNGPSKNWREVVHPMLVELCPGYYGILEERVAQLLLDLSYEEDGEVGSNDSEICKGFESLLVPQFGLLVNAKTWFEDEDPVNNPLILRPLQSKDQESAYTRAGSYVGSVVRHNVRISSWYSHYFVDDLCVLFATDFISFNSERSRYLYHEAGFERDSKLLEAGRLVSEGFKSVVPSRIFKHLFTPGEFCGGLSIESEELTSLFALEKLMVWECRTRPDYVQLLTSATSGSLVHISGDSVLLTMRDRVLSGGPQYERNVNRFVKLLETYSKDCNSLDTVTVKSYHYAALLYRNPSVVGAFNNTDSSKRKLFIVLSIELAKAFPQINSPMEFSEDSWKTTRKSIEQFRAIKQITTAMLLLLEIRIIGYIAQYPLWIRAPANWLLTYCSQLEEWDDVVAQIRTMASSDGMYKQRAVPAAVDFWTKPDGFQRIIDTCPSAPPAEDFLIAAHAHLPTGVYGNF